MRPRFSLVGGAEPVALAQQHHPCGEKAAHKVGGKEARPVADGSGRLHTSTRRKTNQAISRLGWTSCLKLT